MNTSILVGGATGSVATERLLEKGVPARDPKTLPTLEDSWVVPRQLDMTSDASVEAAVSTARDVDVLVNNSVPVSGIDLTSDVINLLFCFRGSCSTNTHPDHAEQYYWRPMQQWGVYNRKHSLNGAQPYKKQRRTLQFT